MPKNEALPYDKYLLQLNYIVHYHSYMDNSQMDWSLHLLPVVQACSCLHKGYKGSKKERLQDLTIVTMGNYDYYHSAGDTINDICQVWTSDGLIDLPRYLQLDSSLIDIPSLNINLIKGPSKSDSFKVKMIVTLSTGELFQATSTAIKLTP